MSGTTAAITIFAMPSPGREWARISSFPEHILLRELALKIFARLREQNSRSIITLKIYLNNKAHIDKLGHRLILRIQ